MLKKDLLKLINRYPDNTRFVVSDCVASNYTDHIGVEPVLLDWGKESGKGHFGEHEDMSPFSLSKKHKTPIKRVVKIFDARG
jgi:hypothetical protein